MQRKFKQINKTEVTSLIRTSVWSAVGGAVWNSISSVCDTVEESIEESVNFFLHDLVYLKVPIVGFEQKDFINEKIF